MRVVYLHGFASGPGSTKARFFRRQFERCGVESTVPDLAAGDFERLTITGQLTVVERAAGSGPGLVLAGSSMGGYLAALYAARHPEVERLILMAPAFGFVSRLEASVGPAGMTRWRETGSRTVFHYGDGSDRRLSYTLIEDGRRYEDFPEVTQPALILHGTLDDVVPAAYSEQFARTHPNVRLVLLHSGHELTDVTSRLWEETARFLSLDGSGPAQV